MKFEGLCNRMIVIISIAVFLPLSVVSFLQTQRFGKSGEIQNSCPIYRNWDNPLWHILGIVLVVLLLTAFDHRQKTIRWEVVRISAAIITVIIGLLIYWGGKRTPFADQIQVYSAAMCFSRGEYTYLVPGGYIEMYPQQLGYVAYLQILFRIFGRENFQIVQVINCFLIGGVQYCINNIAALLTEDTRARLLSEVLTLLCVPLFLMGSWVYGDIPSLFFAAISADCFLKVCVNGERITRLHRTLLICGMLLASVTAVLFRKNMWILVISLTIAGGIYAVESKKKSVLIGILVTILLSAAVGNVIEYRYETVSQHEINGLPAIMWIAMGITEGESKPGWFNNFSVPVYYESGFNSEIAAARAVEQIQARMDYFMQNPVYMLSFYKRKIATQWNEPSFATMELMEVDRGERAKGVSAWLLKHQGGVRIFLSVWQNIIYLGALFYCFFAAKQKTLSKNIMLIYFIGGFLFSILWEANSRYIMPYVLFVIPYGAMGWSLLWAVVYRRYFGGKNVKMR